MNLKHPPKKSFEFILTVLLILSCIHLNPAQGDISTNPPSVLTAAKLTNTPSRIDGNLNEDVWKNVPVATGFVQLVTDEGAPASERTEVRVLYGDDTLYVGCSARLTQTQVQLRAAHAV